MLLRSVAFGLRMPTQVMQRNVQLQHPDTSRSFPDFSHAIYENRCVLFVHSAACITERTFTTAEQEIYRVPRGQWTGTPMKQQQVSQCIYTINPDIN